MMSSRRRTSSCMSLFPNHHRCCLCFPSPALSSSIFGVIVIIYNFLGTTESYKWGLASTSATVLSAFATALYACLLWWKRRIVTRRQKGVVPRSTLYSEQSYYTNYIPNMYPSAIRTESQPPPEAATEDDPAIAQMRLLNIRDARPSPDANPFRIDLPEDREEQERYASSQELVGTPQPTWTRTRSDSLGESQAWQHWQDRGRPQQRPSNSDLRSNHSRGISREERRREIELGAR